MKKRFKKKKRINIGRFIISIIFVIFVIIVFKSYLLTINLANSNSEFIKRIINDSNYYSYYKNNNVILRIKSYAYEKLKPNNILESSLPYEKEEKLILVSNEIKKGNGIYLYNSHQKEGYDNKYLSEYNITPDVLMASFMLEEKLEKRGINCIVEENDITKYMKDNNMNHGESYIASRNFLEKFYKKNNDMDLYIDIHRDALSHDLSTIDIDGKKYAKVLFVIGLDNENYNENLNIAEKINQIINKNYNGLSRGIMKKQGVGVNGVYNQDLDYRVILMELGGNENTIEEINNTLDLIANVLEEYINEK